MGLRYFLLDIQIGFSYLLLVIMPDGRRGFIHAGPSTWRNTRSGRPDFIELELTQKAPQTKQARNGMENVP